MSALFAWSVIFSLSRNCAGRILYLQVANLIQNMRFPRRDAKLIWFYQKRVYEKINSYKGKRAKKLWVFLAYILLIRINFAFTLRILFPQGWKRFRKMLVRTVALEGVGRVNTRIYLVIRQYVFNLSYGNGIHYGRPEKVWVVKMWNSDSEKE